jgi:hypothetical protein
MKSEWRQIRKQNDPASRATHRLLLEVREGWREKSHAEYDFRATHQI